MDATPLEIRDALMGYWFNNFTSYFTYYPNTSPNDIPAKDPWVSFDIRFTTSETVIKGSTASASSAGTITRHRGVVFIEIHTQPLTGTKTSYNIATDVCNLMERKRIGGVVTRNANIQELSLDNNYSILVVEIPFLTT